MIRLKPELHNATIFTIGIFIISSICGLLMGLDGIIGVLFAIIWVFGWLASFFMLLNLPDIAEWLNKYIEDVSDETT